MVTNPFVYIETQPYQLKSIIQRVKLTTATLTKTNFHRPNYSLGNQTLTAQKYSKNINKARLLNRLLYAMKMEIHDEISSRFLLVQKGKNTSTR